MQKTRIKMTVLLFSVCIIGLCIASCSLKKTVSVTTGRYENIPSRNINAATEIETARDTVVTYRF